MLVRCLLALWSVSMVMAMFRIPERRTYNIDPKFSRWNKTRIPFYVDPYYTIPEATWIRQAVKQMASNMAGCLTFVEVPLSDPSFKIHFSPYNEYGVLQQFCYSYPGVHNTLINFGQKKQLLTLTRGKHGCLNGSLRNIMKIIAIVLGRRNEHQRGDRDRYLDVDLSKIDVAVPGLQNSYRLYNSSEAYWNMFPYDYCSITHNQPEDYAITGSKVFTPKCNPPVIPKLGQISNTDCQLISLIYQCQRSKCLPLNCTAAQLASAAAMSSTTVTPLPTTTVSTTVVTTLATVSTTPMLPTTILTTDTTVGTTSTTTFLTTSDTTAATTFSTTVATTASTTTESTTESTTVATTTQSATTESTTPTQSTSTSATTSTTTANLCPLSRFCENTPDESTYLNGPWLLSQTMLMFSGPCVMEYNFDWATRTIIPQFGPQLIREYFPTPAGPSTLEPYSLAFQTLDPATGNSYKMTMVNPFAGMENSLTCSMDGYASTHAANCPNPTTTTDPVAIAAGPTVSSASSQLSLMENSVYHYVVLRPARSEIGLMNTDFSVLHQQTSGFLTSNPLNTIEQITAIQIMNDPMMNYSPPMMAVFGYGIGADNTSAYMGLAAMPLGADPVETLSPIVWQGQPKLLRNVIAGC